VKVIALVGRQQGLLTRRGNPKAIESLADLDRSDVLFVNRQRGAGTRVLLDYHLQRIGVDPGSIAGYEREEYTHLAVAAAISWDVLMWFGHAPRRRPDPTCARSKSPPIAIPAVYYG
jgi:putative molybdopterin biosynthesis protein